MKSISQLSFNREVPNNRPTISTSRVFDQAISNNRMSLPIPIQVSMPASTEEAGHRLSVPNRGPGLRSFTVLPSQINGAPYNRIPSHVIPSQTILPSYNAISNNDNRSRLSIEHPANFPTNSKEESSFERLEREELSPLVVMASRIIDSRQQGTLLYLDTEEQKTEEPQEDETDKAIDDILKRKELFDKVSATESAFHLKQVLRNITQSQKRDGQLADILDQEDDDGDFDAIQDDLVKAYDGAQRKTAQRVFSYVSKTQKDEKRQFITSVKKNSIGTDVLH